MHLRRERSLFLMKNRHQRGISRQSVEDGSQGALEVGVRCGFRWFDWRTHRPLCRMLSRMQGAVDCRPAHEALIVDHDPLHV
jgi:hypothetical protein